ncbi:hypothetical protein [Streptomyces sp. NPDC097619]|uniref:hypothetical protein n=1 Tax=Streptomyces sp. NPDC097619 TaxID=3157228 RepID=UPI00332681F1
MDFRNPDSDLPFIDEHRLLVAAPLTQTWTSLTKWVARTHLGISPAFARVVGTDPREVTGTPPEQGSTFPGFAVVENVPESRLTLAGRHRFSTYRLSFVLTGQPGGTMLAARSHGVFPGFHGAAYRFAVIGVGSHRILVRRSLRQIADKAERNRQV